MHHNHNHHPSFLLGCLISLFILHGVVSFSNPPVLRRMNIERNHHFQEPATPSSRVFEGRPLTVLFYDRNPRKTVDVNDKTKSSKWYTRIISDPQRSLTFSVLMMICGALLGPFLDSYHSAFHVLQYDDPLSLTLWGSLKYPALTTAWWVPELFGVAGLLIGWLYILFDAGLEDSKNPALDPNPPKIFLGISFFTLQYWLSGILVHIGIDRTSILNLMSIFGAIGFLLLDGTMTGLITSAATAIGGPLIEIALISSTTNGIFSSGYHYNDLGETGFFPLWIIPVYFLGGPANGNLARGFWIWLSPREEESITAGRIDERHEEVPCPVCNDSRRVPCPSCDGVGTYLAMGNRRVVCPSCRGRGFVICRACFDRYDEDPNDIDAIRELMSRMPD